MAGFVPPFFPKDPAILRAERAIAARGTRSAETVTSTWAKVEQFVNRHFAWVLFTMATVAMAMATPEMLVVGSTVGFLFHCFHGPLFPVEGQTKAITNLDAIVATVGGVAALLRFTPAGSGSDALLGIIPLICSFSVGGAGFRSVCHLKKTVG